MADVDCLAEAVESLSREGHRPRAPLRVESNRNVIAWCAGGLISAVLLFAACLPPPLSEVTVHVPPQEVEAIATPPTPSESKALVKKEEAPETVLALPSPGGMVLVRGYYRSNGTYVQEHYRHLPRR